MIDYIIMNIKDTLQTYTPNIILSKYQFKLINEGLKYYQELFKDSFEIIKFNEIEKDGMTGLGKMKHWHIYNVIAKKK